MSGGLIPQALRALDRPGRFRPAAALARYLRDNDIGAWEREHVRLGPAAREILASALKRDFQVPLGTTAEAWKNLSRTEALDLTTNEKSSRRAVRGDRIAVKAMAGRFVKMDDRDLGLPAGVSLDVDAESAEAFRRHDRVVLVENWEAFERIDRLCFEISPDLENALVVYRGDAGAYPIAAARRFLERLGCGVHVFPDPDPAGLVIAMSFPGYAGLVLPSPEDLAAMFAAGRGDRARFLDQLPGSEAVLEATDRPEIKAYWTVIRAAGRAIPQEEFVRTAPVSQLSHAL